MVNRKTTKNGITTYEKIEVLEKKAVRRHKRKETILGRRITVPRIALLGMLLALIVALKYAFGFILGIELVSFMFVFLGIFLPILDLGLLVICFNIFVMIIYGVGAWEIMYWIIWPVDALVSKLLSKVTRNKYAFAAWGFIAGMSVFFWYFLSDLFFFGTSYAVMNIISAIPVNTIEGLTTMLAIITIAPTMAKIFSIYQPKFWETKTSWRFKEVKHKKFNIFMLGLLITVAITGIVLMFVYNQWWLDLKESLMPHGDGGLLPSSKK